LASSASAYALQIVKTAEINQQQENKMFKVLTGVKGNNKQKNQQYV